MPAMNGTLPARSPRARGLVTLSALVLLGVGVTAGYLQWRAPDLLARREAIAREVAASPSSPEGRLATWVLFGGDPQIHNRLQQMRFSEARPWLVTHAVGAPADAAPEVVFHGIDLASMPKELVRQDGLVLHLVLPAPRELGRGPLAGEHAPFVPVFARAELAPDATARARELVAWALGGLEKALGRDVPGATLVIEIGPATTWAEIVAARAAR